MKMRMVWMLALTAAMTSPVGAQQVVYPAKGQSAQQQAAFGKARAACLEGKGYTVK
jgi:hypothetical protein